MIEEWKDINNYEGLYQISNTGKVKSLINNKILSPNNNGKGYLSVQLGRNNRLYIHRLVGEHFLSNTMNNKEINHINGDTKDNHADNLEWCTRTYNINHQKILGTKPIGSMVSNALLNEEQVFTIKQLLRDKIYKQVHIAKMYNVSTKCISDIKLGYTWQHVV